MNIEIMDFFLLEHKKEKEWLCGTLRVHLPDIMLDLLGVYVECKRGRWFFRQPGRLAKHAKTGQEVWYPFYSFSDRNNNGRLIVELQKKAPIFIDEWFKKRDNVQPTPIVDETPKTPEQKILSKQWDSPPPLKVRKRNDLRNNALAN